MNILKIKADSFVNKISVFFGKPVRDNNIADKTEAEQKKEEYQVPVISKDTKFKPKEKKPGHHDLLLSLVDDFVYDPKTNSYFIPEEILSEHKLSHNDLRSVEKSNDGIINEQLKVKADNFVQKIHKNAANEKKEDVVEPGTYKSNYDLSSELSRKKSDKELNLSVKLYDNTNPVSRFNIYTDDILLGIIIDGTSKSLIVGGNDKKHVVRFMKEFSKEKFEYTNNIESFDYKDIFIKVYFDSKNIVKSLEFSNGFAGSTVNGLKIGDSSEKALKLYGKPIKESSQILSYHKMKLLIKDKKIVSITINS